MKATDTQKTLLHQPIPAKEGLLFRRTNGGCASPGVETVHTSAGALGFIGQKRNFGEKISVDTFF